MLKKSKIVVFFLAITIASCAFAQGNAISDSQFVMLYVDLSFAAEQFLSDSVELAVVQDSIFKSHDVTRDRFFLYKNELDSSPERWSGIWEMISSELTKRESQIQSREKTAGEKTVKKRSK
jgi:hypothetical protein